AITPVINGEILPMQGVQAATQELHKFMLKHTRRHDLAMFIALSKTSVPESAEATPTRVLVPAFMISELKTAFIMGFCIYVPFILIDLLVSTVLMSLGMMMMPPVVVSAPIKLLLFVLVDGWHLIARSIGSSFLGG
ncbi:MAG: EscR/YscR/HrcR family type III secretion system export apparatus protein, partial [Planctomycetales bacterium]|nr:EscR/YscR/HrcR family type III secretion system export apparatus protein [Planctomycetales bacterium]